MSYIGGDDLVFYKDSNNNTYSGGFSVNSIMMKSGISPFTTLNNPNNASEQSGGNVSDLFKNLVVPTWLVSQENKNFGGSKHSDGFKHSDSKHNKNQDSDSDDDVEVISDELYDKLLNLATVSDAEIKNKKKRTRRAKQKIMKNKGTKRNK